MRSDGCLQEWRTQLRSSVHPVLFAGVYGVASAAANFLKLSPTLKADLLLAAPKLAQAVFAAVTDYCTWRLARRIYTQGTRATHVSVRYSTFRGQRGFLY